MKIKMTLKFFRDYFWIPKNIPLRWCVIREIDHEILLKRVGVELVGTNKAVDIFCRNFIEKDQQSLYQFTPAKRISKDKDYVFICEDGFEVEVPKTLVRDIYFRCVYSDEMIRQVLL